MPDNSGIPVLAIVGPTAVGKTALSIAVGLAYDGEAISADSRQIYRHMDIGTAKATAEEQAAIPHHLIDVVEPDGALTLAHYQGMAMRAIEEVHARGRLPIVVGGTGLYLRAVLEGWTIPQVAPNPGLRAEMAELAESKGHQALHQRLSEVDAASAARIDSRNVRRVIRALEVYFQTGSPISQLQRKRPPGYRLLTIGLTMDRPALYERIDARVDRMIEMGLVEEVRWLLDQGYGLDLPAMSGLGYRQIGQYIAGEIELQQAIALIKRHTRRFVRQQYNWFRLGDPAIHWLDCTGATELGHDGWDLRSSGVAEFVRSLLAGG